LSLYAHFVHSLRSVCIRHGFSHPDHARAFNKDAAKDQHTKAIEAANAKAKKNKGRELKPFEPYVLRHTALIQIAQAGEPTGKILSVREAGRRGVEGSSE
jgi:hypothetical protein